MKEYIYKRDSVQSLEADDYAIRYIESEYPLGYAKLKDGKEFATDFTKNNTGYDVYRTGRKIAKEEYESF